MPKQKAAKRPKSLRQPRFPGESAKYRAARNDLLKAESNLRRQLEMVAAKRRKLPLGGELPEDYLFEELTSSGAVSQVRFSELFAGGKGTLIIYNYMFGP